MSDRDCDNCAHHSEGGCSVWECSFTPKEDDTISRQAAVDAICGECQANCIPCEYFPCGEIKAIQALPPSQPNLQPTCNNLATDAISRQAAIDTSLEFFVEFLGGAFEENLQKKLIERINTLPSAQPERKTGKWITQQFGSWAECSECHELYDIPISLSNFCPNCGAKMEEEQ